ncbi:unnamed protein product [Prorocentrum cordatum]|uniref:Helicase C-terminal domain-containing protein n=1 Tax=Prorocentrum cordatum TaxID=2364126 RepID=A0ABN9YG42_9DINO|nr:unnamed protein product [Polarella glacialis]
MGGAWGNHGREPSRGRRIVQLLQWLCSSACEDGPAAVARWAEAKRSGRRASQSVSAGYSAPAAAKVGEQAKQMKGGAGTEALENAVLIFLPGVKEIQTLHEAILATREFRSEPQRSWVLPLHGMLPPDEQRWVFDRAPPGVRKVVIATNIAETAITVDDVSIVIDCGRMKEKRFDPAKRMESLEDVLVSRANAKQRRGRAGRTRPGVAFHLITSFAHDKVIDSFQPPEISRVPLERLVLTIKSLRYVEPASEVCARLLEPPKLVAVKRAVRELVELDALDVGDGGEKLTALGVHLSTLPVDVRIGKLILLGTIFGVVDETLTIAAALSYRSPFLSPFDQRDAADAAKRSFTVGQSDHLAVLKAYTEFDQTSGQAKFEFAREHFLGIKTLQSITSPD